MTRRSDPSQDQSAIYILLSYCHILQGAADTFLAQFQLISNIDNVRVVSDFDMESVAALTVDCKVEMQKYVLIAQPSRWQQKGERVVVQSPILHLSKDTLVVPV